MIKARTRWCTCRVEARSPHNGNHFSSYILEVGPTHITIAPGKVSLFWPNESCTKRCVHSSNPIQDIDTMAKT